jgi:photosystem II stability/assembly factor-like uncharacterized protein
LVKSVAALLILSCVLKAQTQAPVRVEYACPAEDVESFGVGCSPDDPSAVFLEIASVEAVGAKLFLAGNLHAETTTLYGIVLESEDGGKSWTEAVKRVRSAAFEQIEFFDFSRGWISGQIIEPLARDPFMLLSADGGTSWTERPLFDEPRFGSIAQFWFDSPQHGELVLDSDGEPPRHERYESNTGGESWEMKQSTTEAIHLKTNKSTAWRVRADAATKTYHVERRAGSSWETVASFLIHVADCK